MSPETLFRLANLLALSCFTFFATVKPESFFPFLMSAKSDLINSTTSSVDSAKTTASGAMVGKGDSSLP